MEKLKKEIANTPIAGVHGFGRKGKRTLYPDEVAQILTLFQDWLKKNNYVQLSPDQSLPEKPNDLSLLYDSYDGCWNASRNRLIQEGWRRVE